jgi:Domain of unknown function (DUF4193)
MPTDDIDVPTDEETLLEDEEELDEAAEPTPEDLEAATVPPEPGLGEVESIQDLLAKQESRAGEEEAAEEDDDASIATTGRDERLEPLDARVVPIQATEFTCKRCFLVKHRSQLADKKRMLCRDCA